MLALCSMLLHTYYAHFNASIIRTPLSLAASAAHPTYSQDTNRKPLTIANVLLVVMFTLFSWYFPASCTYRALPNSPWDFGKFFESTGALSFHGLHLVVTPGWKGAQCCPKAERREEGRGDVATWKEIRPGRRGDTSYPPLTKRNVVSVLHWPCPKAIHLLFFCHWGALVQK